MRKTLVVFLTFLLAVPAFAQAPRAFYISPSGDDSNDGSFGKPFATLERARGACRELTRGGMPEDGILVILRAGTYERTTPFNLSTEDSGEEARPIVYRAFGTEQVRITAGQRVEDFQPLGEDDPNIDRIPETARRHVVVADLRGAGITDYGDLAVRGFSKPIRAAQMELFFNGEPMTLARWPNRDYARIAGVPGDRRSKTFQYEGDRPERWANEPAPWVYGYYYYDWADTYIPITGIDTDKKTITMAEQHNYGLREGARWMALNLLVELDTPGEYYIDREKGRLYFYPPSPIDKGRAVVSMGEQLIRTESASHVEFHGLILEACRGTAVTIDGGTHNRLVACTIRNTGNRAVSAGGTDHAVIGCDICQNGDGGIAFRGGDRKTLTPANLVAENNHIHNYSRWCHTYRPAIGGGNCGVVARHNLIHHGQHSAIQFGGNENLVEYNEIHSVCFDTGDCGAYYMGRDWTARGTEIRYNYWHHIDGPGRGGSRCVYLDDQASGVRVYGNVFYRVTDAAFIGGGDDNVIENSLFVECKPAVHIDARGIGWQKDMSTDPNGTLHTRLKAMPYKNELWRERYPNLVDILEDDPGVPKRNRIVRNVCIGGEWENIHEPTRKYQTIENNFVTTESQFVDVERFGLKLRAGSPAFQTGFEAIPVEKIGLYEDVNRASWPVEHGPMR